LKVLTQSEVVPYLLKRKLVRTVSIVESDLVVTDVSRRNHNYTVLSERSPSYLLKQGAGPEAKATLAHEAAVYQLLQEEPEYSLLSRYLPRYYGYDSQEGILILELLWNGQSLREYHHKGRFSTTVARIVGDALGTLHRFARTMGRQLEGQFPFSSQLPWILSIHRPDLNIFQQTSGANIQLVQLIQQFPEIGQHLDELCQQWTTETLIHYDFKWDNCVMSMQTGPGRKRRLAIVDWEMADRGDPCWDVASMFNDYLNFWLLSIPITGETLSEEVLELARYPLERMQPAMSSFWQAYVRRMELRDETADVWLLRTMRYTGARMIQTAFEYMQTSVQLNSTARYMLQLSLNILQQPLEAVVDLLGFPLRPLRTI
jgi:thiamine kinase-like enzyme